MKRKVHVERVFSAAPWESEVGYCRALRAGDHIHVTGTAPIDDAGGVFAPGDAEAQAARCLALAGRALAQLGAGPEHVVRTRMFVTDISQWQAFGRAHAAFFAGHPPTTTMVQVQALIDPQMLIEIEVDAHAPRVPAHLAGDPRFHLDAETLAAALDALPPAPPDNGRLVHLVRRHGNHDRELPHSALLTVEDGLVGDLWRTSGQGADAQLAVMQADIGAVIANGQSPGLFGDQLHLDLDLSAANLPIGSRLAIGRAVFEVTPKPHTGCKLYRQRFGAEALRHISAPSRRDRRMRGIYLCVVESGRVVVDDPVTVLRRGPAPEA